jgi:hypothetical protein
VLILKSLGCWSNRNTPGTKEDSQKWLSHKKPPGSADTALALQVLLTKKKMRQLGCRTLRLHLVVPEGDYSKIWFAPKGKRKKSEKDNAETQRALRFAE